MDNPCRGEWAPGACRISGILSSPCHYLLQEDASNCRPARDFSGASITPDPKLSTGSRDSSLGAPVTHRLLMAPQGPKGRADVSSVLGSLSHPRCGLHLAGPVNNEGCSPWTPNRTLTEPQAWALATWHRKAPAPTDRVGEAAADMAFVLAFVGQDRWLSGQADAISGLLVGREAGATPAFVGRCRASGHPSSLITSETVASLYK